MVHCIFTPNPLRKFTTLASQNCTFFPFKSKHLNEAEKSFSLTTAGSSVIDCSVNYRRRWVRFTPNRWHEERRTRHSDILLPTHLLRIFSKLQQDIFSKNVLFSFFHCYLSSKVQTKNSITICGNICRNECTQEKFDAPVFQGKQTLDPVTFRISCISEDK